MDNTSDDKPKKRNKWDIENKERKKYLSYRSSARKFINEMGSIEDIAELKFLICKREKADEQDEK